MELALLVFGITILSLIVIAAGVMAYLGIKYGLTPDELEATARKAAGKNWVE